MGLLLRESIVALSVPTSDVYLTDTGMVCSVANRARVYHVEEIVFVIYSVAAIEINHWLELTLIKDASSHLLLAIIAFTPPFVGEKSLEEGQRIL